jgi:hypothetical protein
VVFVIVLGSASPSVGLAFPQFEIHLILIENLDADFDLAAVGKFDAIRYEVVEDYTEPGIIDRDQVIVDFLLYFHLVINFSEPDVVFEKVKNILKLFSNVDLFVVGLEFVLSDLGHLEDIVGGKH